MTQSKTVLVLGGGVGGIVAARELRKRLARRHRVVLIDRERQHVFAPSIPWLTVGLRDRDAVSRPLERLGRLGIELKFGEIEAIDPSRRAVVISGTELVGDYLVIALGAELNPGGVPGLETAGHNFYALQGCEALRGSLEIMRAGRLVVMTAAPMYRCPAAPYETALLIDAYFRRRGRRSDVAMDVYAAEPGPMGVAGPEVSGAVRQMLAMRDIAYHPEHQVTSVDLASRRLAFADGSSAGFDLLAYVPPHCAPRVVRECGLSGDSGWVNVDRHTLGTTFPGVYAIGDVVSIPLKLGKPLPKAGVFAHREAEVVAKNIAAIIRGQPASARFDGHGACFVEVGGGRAAFGSGNFYAEPVPQVKLHPPSWYWHLGKVLYEKSWLNLKL